MNKDLKWVLDRAYGISPKTSLEGMRLNAKLQAKVWRNQLRNRKKDFVAKEILSKLNAKYPELPSGDLRHITISVI